MDGGVTIRERVSVNCVRFIRPDNAPDGALREFDAEVELAAGAGGERLVIGQINGWLGWLAWLPEFVHSGQPAGNGADVLAAAAIDIGAWLGKQAEAGIEAVLMVDRLQLDPRWRGNRLSRRIGEELIDLLLLTPETTLFLALLEPRTDDGKDVPPGPERDAALRKLDDICTRAGFDQWRSTGVWWMRLGGAPLAQ